MELEPPGVHPEDCDPYPEDRVLREIEEALDAGRPEDALALVEAASDEEAADPIDLSYLEGDARFSLCDFTGAEECFREVLGEDPDCPNARCWLAHCLYRQCRFVDAGREVAAALALPQAPPDLVVLEGVLLEREGRIDDADACYRRANSTNAERFPLPVRLSREEFDREVVRASERLPDNFRTHLDRIPVVVQEVPAEEMLKAAEDPLDPELLGLFVGHELGAPGVYGGGGAPDANYIYLFQRTLERSARDRDGLVEQIAVTLYHELGHYLGFDEDGLDEIGLA